MRRGDALREGESGVMESLLVDGYNLIHTHPVFSRLVKSDMESAREGLLRELLPLSSPDHYSLVMVVFDAAGWGGKEPVVEDRGGVVVVFTRRRQSADSFIEAAVRAMVAGGRVTVATSDRLLRRIAENCGASGMDAETLFQTAREARQRLRQEMERVSNRNRVPLEERISPELRQLLDRMRYR